jgi:hypothetical protein
MSILLTVYVGFIPDRLIVWSTSIIHSALRPLQWLHQEQVPLPSVQKFVESLEVTHKRDAIRSEFRRIKMEGSDVLAKLRSWKWRQINKNCVFMVRLLVVAKRCVSGCYGVCLFTFLLSVLHQFTNQKSVLSRLPPMEFRPFPNMALNFCHNEKGNAVIYQKKLKFYGWKSEQLAVMPSCSTY